MKLGKSKIYITAAAGLVFLIAVIWLVIRGCSTVADEEIPVYHIGRDSTWYPVDLRGKELAMVGFSNDLIKHIAKEQGFEAIVFEVGTHALLDGLKIGTSDAIISSMAPNVINRNRYEFSDPFYILGPVLIVKEDAAIKNLQDMEGKILGIESGALQVFNIPEPPGIIIIPYDSAATALENLDENIIDGVLLDVLRAYVWTEGFYAGRLKVATSPLTGKGIRLITLKRPQYLKLISQFNEGLKQARESGHYDQLLVKWDLIDTELDDSPPMRLEEE